MVLKLVHQSIPELVKHVIGSEGEKITFAGIREPSAYTAGVAFVTSA